VQIRKQRKEQVLRRKRGLPSSHAAAAAAGGGGVANSTGTSSLETCLAAYLQNPRDLSCHKQLENALSLANNSVTAVGTTTEAAAAAAAGTTTATDFLQRLLDEEQAKARALVSNLIDSVQQSQVMLLRESALGILLEVSSSVKSQQDTTYSGCTTTNNDDYYGRPPLRWSDILVSTEERQPNVVMVLLSLLPPPQLQQQQHQPAINAGDSTVETILNILGNLVQDSPQALSILLPHWAILTSHLPASAYCCAAIIRNDQTHYAMDFLQAQQPQQQHHISPLQLTQLLRDDRTAVEAAWILEGLSRREDEAVHFLCGRRGRRMVEEEEEEETAAEETDMLLPCLIQRIHHHSTTSSTTTASKEFLVPALRAVGNLCTACEGQYVVDFLQQQQPAFVEAMNRLLEQKTVLDAVSVAGSLLTDAGLPGHPSTDTALPNFLPRLIAILLSEHSTFAWKRDAAFAISNAVASSSSFSQLPSSSPGAVVVYEHDDALLQRMEIESYRLAQLRYYVWTDSEEHQHRLMQVLGGEFLKMSSQSHEAVVPALEILDKLVRNIEASRFLFDSHGGVDLLEDVCANSSGSTTDEAAEIAARLIDDIFDTDDGDSIDYEASSLSMPAIENNQFVFGGAPAMAAFRSDSATSMETTTPPQAGAGRGRGRTMPAWMVQQQQQQS